ncbi:MAG: polyhydroxyalkanoate synthesis repressor PhaR [Hyphomicrobiales bacterium]|nr:polyhydroxyalkanoate synthesis repressor PhaR [Hyphomicrobiales bacterium]
MQHPKDTAEPVVIKKYANRRLYNTDSSTYVTLDDLAEMVKSGRDFVVYDAKSGADITRSVLAQIIFEQEGKGPHLLPIRFLRQLIRFYDDNMQKLVPSYLEFSLESLAKEQEKFQRQMAKAWGVPGFDALQEQVQRNLAVFEKALGVFYPFTAEKPGADTAGAAPKAERGKAEASGENEIEALKRQLGDMQSKLETLSRK